MAFKMNGWGGFQKVEDDKTLAEIYSDIHSKEGRVVESYKDQKDVEDNIQSNREAHKKKFKTMHDLEAPIKGSNTKPKNYAEAFAYARNEGLKEFKFKGTTYSTRYKEEPKELFEKSFTVGTQQYKDRIKEMQSRRRITHGPKNPVEKR
tara:strand:+ start:153 stop:599 length:447 start_codon:yes stop_codon:yes gene_type:complete